MEKLAPETLAEILVHLPYRSLLRAMGVCRRWIKNVINSDRNLRVAMFKTADTSTLCGLGTEPVAGKDVAACKQTPRPVRRPRHFGPLPLEMLHPALINKIRYRLGDPASSASLLPRSRALTDYPILYDLACIPATKSMTILITQTDSVPPCHIDIKAENPNGVRIGDILKAMAQMSRQNTYSPCISQFSSYLQNRTFLINLKETVWRGTAVEAKVFVAKDRSPPGLADLVATRWFRDDRAEDPEEERLRSELLDKYLFNTTNYKHT
ncbi:hypothetical protein BD779DRAFT_340277 [Infundibulicybe gibba]|nr:hypothetical protein BD779DRAFT_340277 [Infundibulicybe gibba]